jgi:Domain of unknown function (DUF5668)
VSSPAGPAQNRGVLGLVLVVVGSVLALDSAGILRSAGLGTWWPLLLIGAGFVKVRQPREDGQRAAGVAFLMLGGVLQLTSILAVSSSWPLLMVALGAFLLWRGVDRPAPTAVVSQSPWVSDMTLLGYVKRSYHSAELRGGAMTAVMGVMELDLRKAGLVNGACIDVVAFWGGIEIKVPDTWTVDASVVPLMGAFQSRPATPLPSAAGPHLVLRGHAIMGAVIVGS